MTVESGTAGARAVALVDRPEGDDDRADALLRLRDVDISYGSPRRRRTPRLRAAVAATPVGPTDVAGTTVEADGAAAELSGATAEAPAAAAGPAVRGVDLDLRSGEMVGLVGESGSGKSTVALACLGLLPVSAGSLDVLGTSWEATAGRRQLKLRGDIQAVFQDPHRSLDPRQKVSKGLNELRRLHGDRTDWTSNEALMEQVGLDAALLHRYPHQLSGGQAQRVAIARALLLRPRIVVADEATSALDVSVQAQILRLLRSLKHDLGISFLLISHDLAVVRQVCDRVYVMHKGEVVESGETESVLANPSDPYTRHLISCIPGAADARDTATEVS